MLYKVHRVMTPDEASHFEALGAELIGVSMAEDDHFADDRTVDADTVAEIERKLIRAELIVEPPRDRPDNEVASLANELGAKWIQSPFFAAPSSATRARLAGDDIGLIVSRVAADEDMDPSWVLTPIRDLGEPSPDLIEIEVVPLLANSWRVITEESPQYPEELQVEDIDDLARQAPLLVSADFTLDNVQDIENSIPHARGLSLTLGTLADGVSGLHVLSPSTAEEILETAMRGYR